VGTSAGIPPSNRSDSVALSLTPIVSRSSVAVKVAADMVDPPAPHRKRHKSPTRPRVRNEQNRKKASDNRGCMPSPVFEHASLVLHLLLRHEDHRPLLAFLGIQHLLRFLDGHLAGHGRGIGLGLSTGFLVALAAALRLVPFWLFLVVRLFVLRVLLLTVRLPGILPVLLFRVGL